MREICLPRVPRRCHYAKTAARVITARAVLFCAVLLRARDARRVRVRREAATLPRAREARYAVEFYFSDLHFISVDFISLYDIFAVYLLFCFCLLFISARHAIVMRAQAQLMPEARGHCAEIREMSSDAGRESSCRKFRHVQKSIRCRRRDDAWMGGCRDGGASRASRACITLF